MFATFHVADEGMLDAAVQSASRAFVTWRAVPLAERRALLMRLADLMRENAAHLAHLVTLEQGKPLADAKEEIESAIEICRHYATLYPTVEEDLFTTVNETYIRTYTPLGVVAGIIPWNFPFFIVAMKVAPALLTGNVIIIKPSPTTPATTLEFARLCATVVPAGVLQVLGDDGSVGPLLSAHTGVHKISFTGSTQTGRKLMAASAPSLKRLTLELGGNDPAVVLEDADVVTTADAIFQRAFRNAGQMCGAVKRVYVHESLYELFWQALAKRLQSIVVGNGLELGVTMGPVQNRLQHDKAMGLLAHAAKHGRILAQKACPVSKGYFVPPTLFGDLDDRHPLVVEEQFAPLLPILSFRSDDEVIARANDTAYGLTASVWSADERRAQNLVQKIDAALLCVNKHNRCSFHTGLAMAKQSGSGWIFGEEGLKEYLQPHLLFR